MELILETGDGLAGEDLVQAVDLDAKVGCSDGRVSTVDQLFESIMDEGVLGLEKVWSYWM